MNKLLILTSFYALKSSLRFRTIFFLLSLSLDTRLQAYDDTAGILPDQPSYHE